MDKKPTVNVSIILPAYNVSSTIEACLWSIARNSVQPREIIVVDDGSTDNTVDLVRRVGVSGVRVLPLPSNEGPGAARNAGIQNAKGEFVFFLDADCVCAPKWIEAGLEIFRAEETTQKVVGVVGSVHYHRDTKSIRDKIPLNPFYNLNCTSPIRQRADYAAANIAYRKEVLQRLDGFNVSRFSRGREDTDLGFRAASLGKVVYCSQMQVVHVHKRWNWRDLRTNAPRYQFDVIFFSLHRQFPRRWGRVLHPRILLFALFPFSIPIAYHPWLSSMKDWLFLFPLWIYFLLARWHILKSAWRERVFVV